MADLLLFRVIGVMTFFLTVALFGLAYTAWRLFRNRRNPDSWEGGLLWLMSFLVVVILLART
ncbi:MAG TPA: hypothetical protein VGS98_12080 [Thermoanaerobaculia bacterium]|jgi:hypothetical protein|nr:hypothetical protein [Thermoanaerobaculia bacterium]